MLVFAERGLIMLREECHCCHFPFVATSLAVWSLNCCWTLLLLLLSMLIVCLNCLNYSQYILRDRLLCFCDDLWFLLILFSGSPYVLERILLLASQCWFSCCVSRSVISAPQLKESTVIRSSLRLEVSKAFNFSRLRR